MSAPQITQDPLYQLLRDEKVNEFNEQKKAGTTGELSGCDFRGLDLRQLDAAGLDLSNSYFRSADLRGIDFRTTKIEGISISNCKISGCYFPKEVSAEELRMSMEHGTRIRYR
ncbi:MAG: pentapeptide repeat-containing protein [Pseudomonadales bacterium]|nr:pentapeptide repeat-containing protein [Pseudomonadales bacterium]